MIDPQIKQELDQYLDILRTHKAKITTQRIQILEILLLNKSEHFTAEDIIERLSETSTGQATVYRTLELFCKLNILKKVNFTNEEFTQYDLVDLGDKHFHHHLICTKCGRVVEFNDDLLDVVEIFVAKNYKFKVMDHELVIRGICDRCLGENNDTQ